MENILVSEILQYPLEEIFAEKNLGEIDYGALELGGKKYFVGSRNIRNILLDIKHGRWEKNDVLHDTSKLLSKHKPDELNLKVSVYNYLIKEGVIGLIY